MSNIINFYQRLPQSNDEEEKHPIFDLPFRMLVIGPSGSGKTNAALNIIKSLNNIFTDITIITKNSAEPLYEFLKNKLKDQCNIYDGIEQTPSVDSFDKREKHLVIFDDMVLEKNQKPIVDYYIRARKQNCSVMYLSQSFYQTPIMIRKNIGYLVIKKLSSANDLSRIIKETSISETKESLMEMYKLATKEKFSWLMINLEKSRYYKDFELIKDSNEQEINESLTV